MYGDDAIATTAIGELADAGVLIIPEAGDETKQLVLVIEIDLVSPGSS